MKKNTMPEKTLLNLIRAVLLLPFMFLLAINSTLDGLVTALFLIAQKLIDAFFRLVSFSIKGAMMVIGGSFYEDVKNMKD